MMLFLTLTEYAIYLAFSRHETRKTGNKKHAWVWIALFAAGLAVQVLYELGVQVPGPSSAIRGLVSGMFSLE